MNQIAGLQRLIKPHLPQTATMLGRAFYDDPLSIYIYPQGAERERRLSLMFTIALRYTLRYGEITTTSEGTGAACWLPPGNTSMTMPRLLRTGALAEVFKMGLSATRRMEYAASYTEKMHKRHITEPHWYLWVLGVEPEHQGEGIGGSLLRDGLARADASQLPCYLETMKPENVSLYQKFGFKVVEEADIPGSNVHVWSMVRPACIQE